MSTLIAIGYPDEATAFAAEAEAQRLAKDLILQPDALAVVTRNTEGHIKVSTTHHAVGIGAGYGMWWGMLFGILFFVPILGMAVGAGLGALMGKAQKTGIDQAFQEQVRDLLQPGSSALFMILEQATGDKAVEALSQYGGTVLKSSLSHEDEQALQEALHGDSATTAP